MINNVLKQIKKVAFVLILAGSFSSCEKVDNSPEKFRLFKTLYYSKTTSANPTDGVEYLYDAAGNMVKESFYKYNPTELYLYKEYEYLGKQKQKMSLFRSDEGVLKLSWYVVYFYDNENRLIREEFREADDWLSSTTVYEYRDGNLVRQYFHEPHFGDFLETKNTYDAQNRLVQVEKNSSDYMEYKYIKHTYDTEGREKTLEYYDASWGLVRTVEKIYNGRSKLPVKELHYDKYRVQTSQYQHFYDKVGHLVETRLNDDCTLFKRKYKDRLLIEEIIYSKPERGCTEDETIRYEYQKIET